MSSDQFYIEQRPQGDYAGRREATQRASAVLPTQKAAIVWAKQRNPSGTPLVERVRNTSAGGRDKWRSP